MPDLTRMMPYSTPLAPNVNPVTFASVASLANIITNFITKVSGTNQMTGFRLPRGFRGIFVLIPTAAFTGATGGALAYSTDGETEDIPIAKAFTAVADQFILCISDGALVYPMSTTL